VLDEEDFSFSLVGDDFSTGDSLAGLVAGSAAGAFCSGLDSMLAGFFFPFLPFGCCFSAAGAGICSVIFGCSAFFGSGFGYSGASAAFFSGAAGAVVI